MNKYIVEYEGQLFLLEARNIREALLDFDEEWYNLDKCDSISIKILSGYSSTDSNGEKTIHLS